LSWDFLNRGESAVERFERLLIILPDLPNGVLGGDNELLGSDKGGLHLNFSNEWEKVPPMFKIGGEVPMVDVHVIEDDDFFALISIPPLVEWLEIGVRVGSVDIGSLSRSRLAMDPDATYSIELGWPDHVIPSDGFNGSIVLEPKFRIDGFNESFN